MYTSLINKVVWVIYEPTFLILIVKILYNWKSRIIAIVSFIIEMSNYNYTENCEVEKVRVGDM